MAIRIRRVNGILVALCAVETDAKCGDVYLNDGDQKRLKKAYRTHKSNAKRRQIGFYLSFDQWLAWWVDTGKLADRGRRQGQYVMARIGDEGPYQIANIICITRTDNVLSAIAGIPLSPERRERLRLSNVGRKASPQARANQSLAHIGKKLTPGHIQKIAAAVRGRKLLDETKERISSANKAVWENNPRRASEQTRTKMCLAQQLRRQIERTTGKINGHTDQASA